MTYRYTVEAIDEMRRIVRELMHGLDNSSHSYSFKDADVEDRLRTLIIAGVTLANLKEERARKYDEWMERDRAEQARREAARLRALSHWVNYNPYEPLPHEYDYHALIPFQEWAKATERVW